MYVSSNIQVSLVDIPSTFQESLFVMLKGVGLLVILNQLLIDNVYCSSNSTQDNVNELYNLLYYLHCPSMLRRQLSSRSCQHAWITATVSCMVLLMDWCNGFKRSRTPAHVWSPALDSATTYRLFSGNCPGFQSANEFSSSWLFKALHGQAPQCLTDDCQLVAAAGRRQLRSSDAVTCLVPRTRTCLSDRAFGVAGPRLWNALPISLC